MNSRAGKGKVGEREFAELLRAHGFDARRGQQFAGGADSPDVVSEALGLAAHRGEARSAPEPGRGLRPGARAIAAASRGLWRIGGIAGRGSSRWTRTPSMTCCTKALTYFDLWPFVGPRPITMDAELFFQFLREIQRRRHTDEHGYVLPPAEEDETSRTSTPDLRSHAPQQILGSRPACRRP